MHDNTDDFFNLLVKAQAAQVSRRRFMGIA